MHATNDSTISSLAGAIAIAGFGAKGASGAIGASVAYNFMGGDPADSTATDSNSVKASLENITGTVRAGTLDFEAKNTGSIASLTLAGAAAGSFALGGAVSVNTIHKDTEAFLKNVPDMALTGTSATSLSLHAEDTSTSNAWGGGIGIAIPKKEAGGLAAGL